jgi:serine/threonine-protein kinase
MSTESSEDVLADLLLLWEEQHRKGQSMTAAALCAERPELAPELERRIRALRALETPLNVPDTRSLPETAKAQPSLAVAEPREAAFCVSTFRGLRFHAQGGLGEIFKATGSEIPREVALKFIKRRIAHDPDSLRRFLLEAEITGRLEHPGIVPVYGLGTDGDNNPCYAMRLVRGETLDEAIDRLQKTHNPEERDRELRALVRRLISVCNTVAFAHSRGILHRDLKPKNIMLGPYGETLVLDWGLAKVFDAPEAAGAPSEERLTPSSGGSGSGTPTVGVVGSPGFMSPEQAQALWDQVGPASDVYSLGATLHCILTGQPPPPVRRAASPAMISVNTGRLWVPRALEAICCKAIAPQSDDRYPGAIEFATDLEQWLEDRPTSVFREPWLVRLSRWARRHRTAVAAALGILTTGFVALGISAIALGTKQVETDRERLRAEANFQKAREAVDVMLSEVGSKDLADVPAMEGIRRALLERALQFYEGFLDERDDPATRHDVGLAQARVGAIRLLLGQVSPAVEAYRQAVDRLAKAATESGDRGRGSPLAWVPPPSEPYGRISRIRLSG